MFRLERRQRIPRPVEEVFGFFTNAANLERLTPPFLQFRILTRGPIVIRPGALIDYRILLFGQPVRWQTRIESVEPNRCFTDVQLRGPYEHWHHTHEFTAIPAGTEMTDRVDYRLPFGAAGRAGLPFVRSSLKRIFDYRRQQVDRLFGRC